MLAFVREQPGVPRADALLAGFTNAVIARAIKAGALFEREIEPATSRGVAQPQAVPAATHEQAAALERIDRALAARSFEALLLYGVTGSGKTYVYVEAIKGVVRKGGRAIVLVPEISLTPQTARRFEAAFGERVAVLHSALSQRERFEAWQACRRGEIDVVVGARSAVFAPLTDVRLIVVDESHDPSYKQDSVPRYQAVAVARERMRRDSGVLLFRQRDAVARKLRGRWRRADRDARAARTCDAAAAPGRARRRSRKGVPKRESRRFQRQPRSSARRPIAARRKERAFRESPRKRERRCSAEPAAPYRSARAAASRLPFIASSGYCVVTIATTKSPFRCVVHRAVPIRFASSVSARKRLQKKLRDCFRRLAFFGWTRIRRRASAITRAF